MTEGPSQWGGPLCIAGGGAPLRRPEELLETHYQLVLSSLRVPLDLFLLGDGENCVRGPYLDYLRLRVHQPVFGDPSSWYNRRLVKRSCRTLGGHRRGLRGKAAGSLPRAA